MAANIDLNDLSQRLQNHIQEHPYTTGLHVVNGILLFTPGLAFVPVLGTLGFTALGPAAGTLAASAQSILSPIGAGSLFATLQSAAMGGSGAAILAGITQAGSVSSSAVAFALSMFGEDKISAAGDCLVST